MSIPKHICGCFVTGLSLKKGISGWFCFLYVCILCSYRCLCACVMALSVALGVAVARLSSAHDKPINSIDKWASEFS